MYEIMIASFCVKDKFGKKEQCFEKSIVIADIRKEMVLKYVYSSSIMFISTMSKYYREDLYKVSYHCKISLTICLVKFIHKKFFLKTVLDANLRSFVGYLSAFKVTRLLILPYQVPEITILS